LVGSVALASTNACSHADPGGGGGDGSDAGGSSGGILPSGDPDSGGGSSGGGNACPSGQPLCGANCCDSGSVCVDDGTGNTSCAQVCSTSSECPEAKDCCTVLDATATTGTGACMPDGTANGQACMCSSAAECESGTCGYEVDSNDLPVDVPICVANDGAPYDGCDDDACGAGFCCVQFSFGTTPGGSMCQKSCASDAECDANSTCQALTSGSCDGSAGSCVPVQ
jgi:hypothetical protein